MDNEESVPRPGRETVAVGCSSTLREVRAHEPVFQYLGIPASRHFEVARCVRDVLDEGAGGLSLVQQIESEADGIHVIGRPDGAPAAR